MVPVCFFLDTALKRMHNGINVSNEMRKGDFQLVIRLIALDLDGTLLTDRKEILPETWSALTDAGRAGIEIVPATGRPLSGVPENVLALPCLQYLITSNGALTYHVPQKTVLRRHLIPRAEAAQILSELKHPDLLPEIFIDGRGYHEAETSRIMNELYRGTPLENYLAGSRTVVDDLTSFLLSQTDDVENISILFLEPARMAEDRIRLSRHKYVTVVQSAPHVLEIGSADADKGKAVSELASTLGISRSEIMVFGDSNNDFGLFDSAGTAVAMANATPELKARAHRITSSNEEDGIGCVLREIISAK